MYGVKGGRIFAKGQDCALATEAELGVVIRGSVRGIMGPGWSAGWLRELAPAKYALVGGAFTAAYLGLDWLTVSTSSKL